MDDSVKAWEITTPEDLPEPLADGLKRGHAALVKSFGPIVVARMDPTAHGRRNREGTLYFLRFPGNMSIRQDGRYNGPGSICFYGPGGVGPTLDACLESAISSVSYLRGGIVVNPPEGVYGPVVARASIGLYGEWHEAINKIGKLTLAMAHAIGRIPLDWPDTPDLEPVEQGVLV
jgi:hypothetical protein